MGFLDNSGDIILDAVLTDTGRKRLARGDGSFRISKFALAFTPAIINPPTSRIGSKPINMICWRIVFNQACYVVALSKRNMVAG